MITERILTTEGNWRITTDGVQWILQRRYAHKTRGEQWTPQSYVRSTRDILALCIREKGCDISTANKLLSDLPSTFDGHDGPSLKP